MKVNNILAATNGQSGTVTPATTAIHFSLGYHNGARFHGDMDEVVTYQHSLTDARLTALAAARTLGFSEQGTGSRIANIITQAGLDIATSLDDGIRNVQPTRWTGQGVLEEIRRTVNSEAGDAMFFVDGNGTARFHGADNRSSPPQDTSQATFGDTAEVWIQAGELTVT